VTNNRYGTFPSASLLWRIGDEDFLQAQPVFDDLAAAGQLRPHRQPAGPRQLRLARALRRRFQLRRPARASRPSQLANPDLRWESTDQLNLGGDAEPSSNDRLA
jgi:TonB-dependent starch-binding outer membrane protein SusC